eukprot:2727313-Rhodomonas_salina.1
MMGHGPTSPKHAPSAPHAERQGSSHELISVPRLCVRTTRGPEGAQGTPGEGSGAAPLPSPPWMDRRDSAHRA